MNSAANKRDILVRESLQRQLNTCVMEMQSAPGVVEGIPVSNCEETIALCSILEAIFLHGLKDSLLNRVTEALSGPDFDAMPQPSFWGPLLVFSHRQIIDQIQTLTQVTTEVGYCRAWIRIALNEGLLASYLSSIRRDNSALKPYYNKAAFIRDLDLVEITEKLIENMDYVRFELACNSSLLNFWSSTPLLMAAIWSPPLKSCPVFSAVDIAKTISNDSNDTFEDVETASSIGSLGSFNSSLTTINNIGCLSEDDALKIILKSKHRESQNSQDIAIGTESTDEEVRDSDSKRRKERREKTLVHEKKDATAETRESNVEDDLKIQEYGTHEADSQKELKQNVDDETGSGKNEAQGVGNSLMGRLGWSTSFEDCASSLTSSVISQTSDNRCTPAEAPTYDALIKSYNPAGYSESPDLQELINTYPLSQPIPVESIAPSANEQMSLSFDEQLERIPRERGLDTQNYSCYDCGQSIGMTFAKAHVCFFFGGYYCSNCMSDEEFLIPSRIIHNWDLKHYPVCQRAATYLMNSSALLDLKTINPKIYSAVEQMAQLQTLRIQLNLLRAYLFTCREPVIESLQKKVFPRDYLYEHIHQYSVSDLLDIPNGALAQQLQKIIEFAKNHVMGCWLCSQKGFICEVCKNPKVIYPFDLDSNYRCGACNAVFHSSCLNSNKVCPKCERRRKRMDLSQLDIGGSELPLLN